MMEAAIRKLVVGMAVIANLSATQARGAGGSPLEHGDAELAWFGGAAATGLTRLHDAYLRQDRLGFMTALKQVMLDQQATAEERTNAMGLLAKANAQFNGQLPVDWHLPGEVPKMKIEVSHRQRSDRESYKFGVAGTTLQGGTIKQLKITRYEEGVVVLDKAAGLGEWEEGLDPDDKEYFYNLKTQEAATPPADGLYLLHLELANGKETDGWFVLSDLVSTSSPMVETPAVGEKFTTATPTFKWSDFHSPEHKSFERRTLWLAVYRDQDSWPEVLHQYQSDPTLTELTVGSATTSGSNVRDLANGKYIFALTYSELRKFGDLTLKRQSILIRPFQVGVN